MKRLQALPNKTATLEVFCPSRPATLITYVQCMQNEVDDVQKSQVSILSCLRCVTSEKFAFEFSLNPLALGQRERGRTAFLVEDSREYLKAKKLEPFWTFPLLMLQMWLLASALRDGVSPGVTISLAVMTMSLC